MAKKCEFFAALDRGEYVPVSECPCDSCRFAMDVSLLEDEMIDETTGELRDDWAETGFRQGRMTWAEMNAAEALWRS